MYQGVKINYFTNETGTYVEYRDIETDRVLRTANILDPTDYDVLTSDEQQAIIEGLKNLGLSRADLEEVARTVYEDLENEYLCNVYFTELNGKEVADFTKTESDGKTIHQAIEVGTLNEV